MAHKFQYQVAVVNTPLATIGTDQTAVTFSSNTTSTTLICGGTTPSALIIPSSFLAGTIAFNVSRDGVNFYTLTNFDGSAFTVAAAGGATQWIPLQPSQFCGVLFMQLVSSVSQTGSPTVDVSLIPIFSGIHN